MKRLLSLIRFLTTTVIAILAVCALAWLSHPVAAAELPAANAPAPSSTSDGALFTAFVPVLRHPRCMNCHSHGDFPRQGDDGHPHTMNVRRGSYGRGVTAEKCGTCHQDHNLDGAHLPPGAPNWGLPPVSIPMIWEGLTDAQICQSIKDPKQNRNRNLDQLVEHLTEDKLVLWAWNPGEGRAPVPMPHEEFASKVKQWRAAGAPCP
ncbi:MAG: hypothetical protein WB755_21430 [Terriglobales bacterium]